MGLADQINNLNTIPLDGLTRRIAAAQAKAEAELAAKSKETWSEAAIRQHVVPVLDKLNQLKK